jgi:3-hydroxyisobutyrate dehydrogenase
MTAITKVSFVGIGNMGAPMAAHLIERGFDVTVFDVRREAVREFVNAYGGKLAISRAEAGRTAQAAITMLPDHTSVREALLENEGIASALETGAIAIDMSTSDPRATVSIGDELAQRGIGYLDAPVMGGVVFAKDATLDILVGGDDAQIEQCMPLFMAMGRHVFRCGPLGSAHALKLLANYVNASTLVVVLEAMAVGLKFGLDMRSMTDALASMCCGRQHPLEKKVIPQVLTRKFGTGMALGLMAKDVALAADFADAIGAASPLAGCMRQIWTDAAARIGSKADHTEIVQLWEDAIGAKLDDGSMGSRWPKRTPKPK